MFPYHCNAFLPCKTSITSEKRIGVIKILPAVPYTVDMPSSVYSISIVITYIFDSYASS